MDDEEVKWKAHYTRSLEQTFSKPHAPVMIVAKLPFRGWGPFPYLWRMPGVVLKIINTSNNPLPHYATEGAAGMDVRAFLPEPVSLKSLERTAVPTGIFLEIPCGFEVQVRPRSGLALRQGITCLNTPGTIDSDYRGELKIILINLSGEPQVIRTGDRIAQLVVQKVEQAMWQEVQTLSQTERNAGGFGSTGKF